MTYKLDFCNQIWVFDPKELIESIFLTLRKVLMVTGVAPNYTELRRYQHDLASFTTQYEKRVTLPSHSDPGQFTSGAIDSWDHEETNSSMHDAFSVLYQNKPQP